jgi:hypothetical protein
VWAPTAQRQDRRDGLRSETDLTAAVWTLIAPRRSCPCPTPDDYTCAGPLERSQMGSSPCSATELPGDSFPLICRSRARSCAGSARGEARLFETINHLLVITDRKWVGREASPSALVANSQSVKAAESGGPRGYDAGETISSHKRQVMVNTDWHGPILEPHPADMQDWDVAPVVLPLSRRVAVHRHSVCRQCLCRRGSDQPDSHRNL